MGMYKWYDVCLRFLFSLSQDVLWDGACLFDSVLNYFFGVASGKEKILHFFQSGFSDIYVIDYCAESARFSIWDGCFSVMWVTAIEG
jgi:hypothetical protein